MTLKFKAVNNNRGLIFLDLGFNYKGLGGGDVTWVSTKCVNIETGANF